jgi:hypothetical protein
VWRSVNDSTVGIRKKITEMKMRLTCIKDALKATGRG